MDSTTSSINLRQLASFDDYNIQLKTRFSSIKLAHREENKVYPIAEQMKSQVELFS
jgi:hypothetical protein